MLTSTLPIRCLVYTELSVNWGFLGAANSVDFLGLGSREFLPKCRGMPRYVGRYLVKVTKYLACDVSPAIILSCYGSSMCK